MERSLSERIALGPVLHDLPSPCYLVDEEALQSNLNVLASVKERTGCRILLALKAFGMFYTFPMLRRVLDGTCASSPHEAQLGREEFGGEVHAFAAAYSQSDLDALLKTCDHIDFNSFTQLQRFRSQARRHADKTAFGLRINPMHSTGHVPLYDPCAPHSRLGIRRDQFAGQSLDIISGLHFHTLCEQNADALATTLDAVEKQFGDLLHQMKWLNMGGGHHITRADYDIDHLCRLIDHVRQTYDVEVYLEPGEAVALNAGVLVCEVLDIIENGMSIAILNTSAACHMPDVLEMPYRPAIYGADEPGIHAHTYRLAGLTCLAGDVIGDYSFAQPLHVGDRLVFGDMAHYTMVKNNTFNGIPLPAIVYAHDATTFTIVRSFGYQDFKHRLS